MKRRQRIAQVILVALMVAAFLYYSNNSIQNTEYLIDSPIIENQITIVHLSDLHGKQFGTNNRHLIENVRNEQPDIIVFTGDLIDAYRNNNVVESVEFLGDLSEYAPVYYIRGNHEYLSTKYGELMTELYLREDEISILDGGYADIDIYGQDVSILGIDRIVEGSIREFESKDSFKIILDHYSENFSENLNLSQLDADLVFTGHAHGGQWRLPFIGGVYAPGQGFNPEHYQGMATKNGSTQVISRGLGNSVFPFRLFNRPEVVTVKVK